MNVPLENVTQMFPYLHFEATKSLNASLFLCKRVLGSQFAWCPKSCDSSEDCKFYPTLDGEIKLSDLYGVDFSKKYDLIVTRFDGITYFSCYAKGSLDFLIYFVPFSFNLWIALICTVCIISTVVWFYTERFLKIGIKFNVFLTFFGFLVDEYSFIPKRLDDNLPFRLINIPWLFIGTLFSVCYIGILIEFVNSPLPKDKIRDFEHLACYKDGKESVLNKTIYNVAKAQDYYYLEAKERYNPLIHLTPGERSECFSILSKIRDYEMDKFVHPFQRESYETFSILGNLFDLLYYNFSHSETKLLFYLLNPKRRFFPKSLWNESKVSSKNILLNAFNQTGNLEILKSMKVLDTKLGWEYLHGYIFHTDRKNIEKAILKEITDCDEPSAYLGEWRDVSNYVKTMDEIYPTKDFYQGKERIFSKPWGIAVWSSEKSKLPKLLKNFVEFGVYQKLTQIVGKNLGRGIKEWATSYVGKEKGGEGEWRVRAIKLSDSVQSMFIIHFALLGVCSLIFIRETRKSLLVNIWRLEKAVKLKIRRQMCSRSKSAVRFK